jgi:hypothetical protein
MKAFRQPFVIDSCSFLHAFHIEIADLPLCDLLQDHFEVLVHREVDIEVPNALRQAFGTWQAAGLIDEEFSSIRRRHVEWASPKLRHDDVEEMAARMGNDLVALDAGERACIAFAKQMADSAMTYPLFLTDDHEAAKTAGILFHKYQCGFVVRTADLITFFGIRYGLSKQEVHQAFRSLLAFYNSTYQHLMAAVSNEDIGSTVLSDFVWRGQFDKAKLALSTLTISADRRKRLEILIQDAEKLSQADSVIGYTLNRLRLLAETNI